MDDLELFMDGGVGTPANDAPSNNQESQDDDLLGLDQQIKLTTRAKIAKIDNERIFDKNKGINYIIRHYGGVVKTFKKNDKKLAKRLASNPNFSSKSKRQLKYDNEVDNLSSVLQFYQLWCHGLFPKARFRDCLHLVRAYGQKSAQMRLYRRELLDQEIEKLKVAKGLVAENDVADAPSIEPETSETAFNTVEQEGENLNFDDDWSFMNANKPKKRGLFIDDEDGDEENEDQLYSAPGVNEASITAQMAQDKNETNETESIPRTAPQQKETGGELESDDPFSDDDADIVVNNETSKSTNPEADEAFPDEEDIMYSNEYEIMKEMGL